MICSSTKHIVEKYMSLKLLVFLSFSGSMVEKVEVTYRKTWDQSLEEEKRDEDDDNNESMSLVKLNKEKTRVIISVRLEKY